MPSERLAKLEASTEHTNRMVCELHAHILGSPGREGLTARLARVEQKQSLHSKLSWAGFLAILGMAVAFVKSKV